MIQKRRLALASGIILIFSALMYILLAVCGLSFNDAEAANELRVMLEELVLIGELAVEEVDTLIDAFKKFAVLITIICAVIAATNITLGVLLIRFSRAKDDIVRSKKALILTSAIVSIFTSGLLCAALLFIAYFTNTDRVVVDITQNVQTENANITQKDINEKYETKIRRLQNLRDSGAITKEEYNKLLKQIFED